MSTHNTITHNPIRNAPAHAARLALLALATIAPDDGSTTTTALPA